MFAPNRLYGNPLDNEPLPVLRGLLSERPSLARCGPEIVRRALWTLRGVKADPLTVEAAMEALQIEGELLA